MAQETRPPSPPPGQRTDDAAVEVIVNDSAVMGDVECTRRPSSNLRRPSSQLDKGKHDKEWTPLSHPMCCLCYGISVCCGMVASFFCSAAFAWCWNVCCIPRCCCWWGYQELDDALEEMDTGDVLIFSGNRILSWAQFSHWSHVGMVYIKRNEDGTKTPYIWEANYGDLLPDGSIVNGSGIWPLREKIRQYKDGNTDVAYRQLPKEIMTDEMRDKFDKAVESLSDIEFDHDNMRGAKAIYDCCPCCEHADEDLHAADGKVHAMFCSELVAATYQDVGILKGPPNGPPSSEYVPRDFAKDPGCNVELDFLKEMGFGPKKWIKRADPSWCFNNDWCICCPCGDKCWGCNYYRCCYKPTCCGLCRRDDTHSCCPQCWLNCLDCIDGSVDIEEDGESPSRTTTSPSDDGNNQGGK